MNSEELECVGLSAVLVKCKRAALKADVSRGVLIFHCYFTKRLDKRTAIIKQNAYTEEKKKEKAGTTGAKQQDSTRSLIVFIDIQSQEKSGTVTQGQRGDKCIYFECPF
jgi:hypothetical protein